MVLEWEETREFLSFIDVLVDGEFMIDKKDLGLKTLFAMMGTATYKNRNPHSRAIRHIILLNIRIIHSLPPPSFILQPPSEKERSVPCRHYVWVFTSLRPVFDKRSPDA